MRCCGVAAKPTIQVRCDGARRPTAFRCPVSKPGTQSAVLDQIVAVYLRWSHVAWTPSWFAVETSGEGLPQHPVAGQRILPEPLRKKHSGRKSQQLKAPWLSIKKLGLDRRGVKAMMHGAQKSGG